MVESSRFRAEPFRVPGARLSAFRLQIVWLYRPERRKFGMYLNSRTFSGNRYRSLMEGLYTL